MGKRYIIGDLHGSYKALIECLEKVSFDNENDSLYFVGDVADGYPDVYKCIKLFMELKNFYPVIGNHDIWLQDYLYSGHIEGLWLQNGGKVSIASFENVNEREKKEIAKFLSTWPYARVLEKEVIMHGGPGYDLSVSDIERIAKMSRPIDEKGIKGFDDNLDSPINQVLWDRSIYYASSYDDKENKKKSLGLWSEEKTLIIGHTEIGKPKPFISKTHNIINLDTGCGSYFSLIIMDMDTKEYLSSNRSMDLYPGYGPFFW